MNDQRKKTRQSAWFWVLFVIIVCLGIYNVFSFWLPYIQWKQGECVESWILANAPRAKECADNDTVCQEENYKITQAVMKEHAKLMRFRSPMFEVIKMPDFIEAMKHPDGSICYHVDTPVREVTDEELKAWLKSYGAKRFYVLSGFFLRVRGVYEAHYHLPNATTSVLARLKWHHTPLGKTWRIYNTAENFFCWSPPPPPREKIPEERLFEILPIMIKHGEYFTIDNFFRLLDMAKAELNIDELRK